MADKKLGSCIKYGYAGINNLDKSGRSTSYRLDQQPQEIICLFIWKLENARSKVPFFQLNSSHLC